MVLWCWQSRVFFVVVFFVSFVGRGGWGGGRIDGGTGNSSV